MKKVILAACLAMLLATGVANAAPVNVAQWDTSGKTGSETSITGIDSTNLTTSSLVRGSGLTASSAANNFGSTGWNGTDSNDYYQFGFSVANGYQTKLNELWIATRSSATGPGTIGAYGSSDNFAHEILLSTLTQGNATYLNSKINLSSLAAITGTFYIRLKEIGDTAPNGSATAGTGTFRAGDYYDGANYQNIILTGETTPTPIPAAAWLLGSGLLGLVGIRRRQK